MSKNNELPPVTAAVIQWFLDHQPWDEQRFNLWCAALRAAIRLEFHDA